MTLQHETNLPSTCNTMVKEIYYLTIKILFIGCLDNTVGKGERGRK